MTASNESLSHVSYPTAVLAKSSKLIPTMIVGFFIEHKSFLVKEWFSAALITSGIIGFNLSRINQQQKSDHGNKEGDDSIYGLCLLVFSLMADGFLASCQNQLKKEDEKQKQKPQCQYRKPTALETMLWINTYAIIFLLPLSIWSGQFSNGIQLINLPNPVSSSLPSSSPMSIRATILMLNLTAATGQIFIFFTIQLFSPLMCTTITTTRKFLTILLSVWKYGHKFNVTQWISIGMVFGGLYLGIVSKFVNSGGTSTGSKGDIMKRNRSKKVETNMINTGIKEIKGKVE